MDPDTDHPPSRSHRDSRHTPSSSSSRYAPREQALPNSSRRIAARQARRSSHGANTPSQSETHGRDRDRDRVKNRDGERSSRHSLLVRSSAEDVGDGLKERVREGHRSGTTHREHGGNEHERERRRNSSAKKRDDKDEVEKKIHDIIKEVKRGGKSDRRAKEEGRSSKRREEEARRHEETLSLFDDGGIDGAEELSEAEHDSDANVDFEYFDVDEFDDAEDMADYDPDEAQYDKFNNHATASFDEGGGKRIHRGYRNSHDSDSDDERDGDSESEYYRPAEMQSQYDGASILSKQTRSNSPELNPTSRGSNHGGRGNTKQGSVTSTDIVTRQLSSDPPAAAGEDNEQQRQLCLDPNEELGSVYQRELELDAPPSPKGPEPNKRRESTKTGGYTNYMLDDVGMELYRQLYQSSNEKEQTRQIDPDIDDGIRKIKIQQDPPESNRGLDVPAPRGPRKRSSKAKKECVDVPTSTKQVSERKKREKNKPEIKSILKKKGSPPPLAFFGKPVSPPPDKDLDAIHDEVSSGSNPSVTEEKLGKAPMDDGGDSKSVVSKSGLRSGRFASINAAARQDGGVDNDGKHNDDSSNDSSNGSSQEESDDENTLGSIVANDDERFDRSRTYYLRTSDLGLTQDTIFAEQFLDSPKSKAEPHYHHPSPHPPPGIQFHVDENWIAINDGKGGHSPIAPQAVDALVAVGYRAACDPVMWTPSSKTRKYMTEKGLRFDDVPLPGPLDEGEGGPNDSTCMVWSGKFSHKYYGHDLIAIRSQGVVNMSAEDLVDLLMDSSRIQEYNKSSNGRTDEIVLSDGKNLDSCPFSGYRKKKLTGVVMDNTRIVDGVAVLDSQSEDERSDCAEDEMVEEFEEDGTKSMHTFTSSRSRKKQSSFVGTTKVVRSMNTIPLVKKKVDFITLLHCRALTDDQGGNGYIIVGRAVCPPDDPEKTSKGVMRSEILLNVHIIRKFKPKKKGISEKRGKGDSRSVVSGSSGRPASQRELANRCLMINVSHLKSPMVPTIMAKKMGLSAAASFISDIRALTE
ncbi:hypothetical protein HJC23_002348 [Cyclotella cryptica]|uniref:START domain-containing protein n=1 Tax=Cyclotella cryptica TaxID=29204 RepID=A0ABD3QKX8_9STRA|eukprot:CCRYP_004444-RA/>CCRYP_004444-RA protein AED:0.08 eAED:0.08 QI:188/1/1/1/1/1/3/296/1027